MFNFSTSLSALRASQVAMDTISNNIANANTPDYHRQMVDLADRTPILRDGLWLGTGVQVAGIRQIASRSIESALTNNIASLAQSSRQLAGMREVETSLAPGPGSLHQRMQALFDEIGSIQDEPSDETHRRIVISHGDSLTNEIQAVHGELEGLRNSARREIEQTVVQVNDRLAALGDLNKKIRMARAAGQQPNDLLDQHQRLINQIAEVLDLQAVPEGSGFTYAFAGGTLSLTQTTMTIRAEFDSSNQTVSIIAEQGSFQLNLQGGSLAALEEMYNQTVPQYQTQLDSFAQSLIRSFDSIHSTGLGLAGGFDYLIGNRTATDTTVPLASAGLPFAVTAGELFISVTDQASGNRTLTSVSIDPQTQSLADIAASISAIPNLTSTVVVQEGKLSIASAPGYSFDFAGRLESVPNRAGIVGNAPINFSGHYAGGINDTLNFAVAGSGDVGLSAGLTLSVTNQAGKLIGVYDVGQGYEPGSRIDLGDGVFVAVDAGTLQAGDNFSTQLVADSDTSDFLVATGLNTFFQGDQASNIDVNQALKTLPESLAISRSGETGDATNAARFLTMREQAAFPDGTTLEGFLSNITSGAAVEVSSLTNLTDSLQVANYQLMTEREAISGVDPNEEMVDLLRFQRSFEAAVRVISVIDETLVELINMAR